MQQALNATASSWNSVSQGGTRSKGLILHHTSTTALPACTGNTNIFPELQGEARGPPASHIEHLPSACSSLASSPGSARSPACSRQEARSYGSAAVGMGKERFIQRPQTAVFSQQTCSGSILCAEHIGLGGPSPPTTPEPAPITASGKLK